jgi:putative Mg2+ transporter-C (MgtC) family protein
VLDAFGWLEWRALHSEQVEIVGRLCAALAAGAAIGFERSFHGRPAGLRTHSLVCLASAMLMLVTVYQAQWFPHGAETVRVDPTRMAQGVMTGIGFLGAGVILKEGVAVRGLTTAASIWITSAIGILAGVGFYFPLVVVTLATLCALSLFRRLESVLPAFSYAAHTVVVPVESAIDELSLKSFLCSLGFDVHQVSCLRDHTVRTVQYDMTIRTKAKGGLTQLNSAWAARSDVVSYSIKPL